jgi:hypothetical protein
MFEIVYALLYSGAIYFSMAGVLPATYVLLVMTSIHLFSVVFISSVLIGTISRNRAEKEDIDIEAQKKARPIKFLFHAFIGISAYHLYNIGYVEYASMLFLTILIAFTSLCIAIYTSATSEDN